MVVLFIRMFLKYDFSSFRLGAWAEPRETLLLIQYQKSSPPA